MSSKNGRTVLDKTSCSEDSSDEEDLLDFQIVEFISRGPKPVQRNVDIVIKPWIDFQKGRMKAKFMAGPYTEEDKKLIHNLTKKLAPAPIDWPWFTVIPRGHARTYKEAVQRLKKLEESDYAFTHDSEDPVSKASKIKKKFQNRKKKLQVSESTSRALKVPSLSESEGEASNLLQADNSPASSIGEDSNCSDSESQEWSDSSEGNTATKSNNNMTGTLPCAIESRNTKNVAMNPKRREELTNIGDKDRGAIPKKSHTHEEDVNNNSQKPKEQKNDSENLARDPNIRKEQPKKIGDKDERAITKKNHTYKQDVNDNTHKKREKINDPENFAKNPISKEQPKKIGDKGKAAMSKKNNTNEQNKNTMTNAENETIIQHSTDESGKGRSNGGKANFYEMMVRRLSAIESDLQTLSRKQDKILEYIASTNMLAVKTDFITKYELELPFQTIDDFNTFDTKLKDDKEFRNAFKSCLPTYFDPNHILRRSIINILKKFLSKKLPPNFTVTKKKDDKYLFSETTMYHCLFDVLKFTTDLTEGQFSSDLGIALRGAKDWEGGRKFRSQNNHGSRDNLNVEENDQND